MNDIPDSRMAVNVHNRTGKYRLFSGSVEYEEVSGNIREAVSHCSMQSDLKPDGA
jgi:hypothetical protein